MRTIAHLSDLHFGRVDHALLAPLRDAVTRLAPDIVVISGDLTQRAKPHEFLEARRYLDSLPSPQIAVPGNHDVPLYNVFQRFFTPLKKFRRYICADHEPDYIDDEVAIVGVNTARSLVFKGGRINPEQVAGIRDKLCSLDPAVIKMVVTHHPFDLPGGWDEDHIVGRAPAAMKTLADCGVDILLAGHVHMSHTGDTTARYRIGDFAALVVQAGTATSTRGRGETNSFNALKLTRDHVAVERHAWNEERGAFMVASTEHFQRTGEGWVRERR